MADDNPPPKRPCVRKVGRTEAVIWDSALSYYIVVDVQPNDDAWITIRAHSADCDGNCGGTCDGSCGGSDIGGYVGFTNNFKDGKRTDVLGKHIVPLESGGGDDDDGAILVRLQHGQKREPYCLTWAATHLGVITPSRMLRPSPENPNFQPGDSNRFHVTTDGEIMGSAVVEAKSPTSERSYNYLRRHISENYLAQVHAQMAVLGYPTAYLVVCWFGDDLETEPTKAVLYEIPWCQEFWNWIYPKACDMLSHIRNARRARQNGEEYVIPDDFDWPWGDDMYPKVPYKIVKEKK